MKAQPGNYYYTCDRFYDFVIKDRTDRTCRLLFYGYPADVCAEIASTMVDIRNSGYRFIEIKTPAENVEQNFEQFRAAVSRLEGAALLVLVRVADYEDGKFVEQLHHEANEVDAVVKICLVLEGGEFILDSSNNSVRKWFQPLDLLYRGELLPDDCPGREEELKLLRIL